MWCKRDDSPCRGHSSEERQFYIKILADQQHVRKGLPLSRQRSHEVNSWKNMLIRCSLRRLSLSLSVSAKSNTPSWDKCVCSQQKPIMRGSMLHETMRIMRAAPSPDISPSVFLSFPFCLFFLPLLFLYLCPSFSQSPHPLPPPTHPSPQLSPSLYVIINREASYLRPGHCLSPAHVWRNCALLQPPSGSLLFLVLLPLLCLCSRGSLRLRLSSWAETLTRPPTKRARQSAEAGDAAACRLCPCRGSAAYP